MSTLTHGPIVGATTARSVDIWARADGAATLEVRLARRGDGRTSTLAGQPVGKTALRADADFTGVIHFDDLEPDTGYTYTALLDGEFATGPGSLRFQTFPAGASGDFSFTFGSCFVPNPYGDEVFKSLVRSTDDLGLRFFLMIGDNVYVDYYIEHVRPAEEPPPENLLALYREAYRHAWGHENFRGFLGQISTYMIFDDHEFWDNWGTRHSRLDAGETYRAACRAYAEYQDCHNPGYPSRHGGDPPQYYYTFEYGDVGFFVLDCRARRNPRALPHASMLGDEQRSALHRWLRDNNERYAVKFVVSSVPITFIALRHWVVNLLRDVLGDQWLGYKAARADLFKFIQDHNISGVHFLSGDIHLGQGVKIQPKDRSAGPEVYSYTSSPLANAFWLLPETPPTWALAAAGGIVGALVGVIISLALEIVQFSPNIPTIFGALLNMFTSMLFVGALGAVCGALAQWVRHGKPSPKPTWFSRFLFLLFGRLLQRFYIRNILGVSRDTISGPGVDYRASNLFPFVGEINAGVVHVRRSGERPQVWFELYDKRGALLRREKPHAV